MNRPVTTRPAAAGPAPAGRRAARRLATRTAILDAFDRLLARGGVAALGVNALVKEAGVGKKALYDRFGGLAGVAAAWVRERTVWQSLESIIGESWEAFRARPPADRLLHAHRCYAESLRRNPRLCELLAGEFLHSPEVKGAVDHVRQMVRADFDRVLASDPALRRPAFAALNLVAYAVATYLGLRAHHQPQFFGFDLSAETPWLAVMEMVERVLRAAGAAAEAEID
ncbi:MAG: TetR/AcrR family transcriptional regulator [Sphingomonadaceae bacterium]|uniref:TetR/AcrR family transcriptional regulator n=1 Tax=Thermaurantiacus sp. TaxID=2820283 RepID=UPI00298ED187|nr:helix-turn-helix domain-containing protein [Thermaurantiacus sp.]MCS6987547.1 TetR/AcrR family transcriptional regulator [Sphingomonadaceae bacterium]MDW8415148.1 helix-turn-helix domain-containing protein [Thermaurantiacus sp.]